MRISDWSSDVCSSDLGTAIGLAASDAWVKERDPVQIGTTHIHHHGRISIAPSAYPSPQTHICHPERSEGSASLPGKAAPSRSEEHTSELQSLMRISYAVFCLKKQKEPQNHTENKI